MKSPAGEIGTDHRGAASFHMRKDSHERKFNVVVQGGQTLSLERGRERVAERTRDRCTFPDTIDRRCSILGLTEIQRSLRRARAAELSPEIVKCCVFETWR